MPSFKRIANVVTNPVPEASWFHSRQRSERRRAEVTLVPVRIRKVAPAECVARPAPASAYEVLLGGGRVLRVPRGFEPAEVSTLVRVLEASSC